MKSCSLFSYTCAAVILTVFSIAAYAGEAQGVLYWAGKTDLTLPVSGVVEKVTVKPGQVVKAGETMLQLDTRRIEARLHSARAMLAQQKPGRDEAQRELERAEELFDRTVLSEVELQQAKIDFAEKDAALRQAEAALTEAGLDLEYSELKAPFELMVLEVHVVPGQAIINRLQSVPLIRVAEKRLAVEISSANAMPSGIIMGKQVKVVHAGSSLSGRVVSMDYDTTVQRSVVRIALDRSPAADAVGSVVKVTWP